MEFAVAFLAGVTVWTTVARVIPRRDLLAADRVAALRGAAAAVRRSRRREPKPLLAALGRRLPGDRGAIVRALKASGREENSPDAIVGSRFLLAAAGALIGGVLGFLAPLSSIALGFLGYRAPGIFLRMRAASRRDEVAAAIPDVVDLLAVCTQAGLNLALALARVADRASGAFGEELRRVVQQTQLGIPRGRALKEMAERNEVPELEALVAALVNAERFGVRVAASLNTLSADIRAKRRRKAEEDARRAPVKILFPLVFLILPGFVLLTLVPLLLGTFATLGF